MATSFISLLFKFTDQSIGTAVCEAVPVDIGKIKVLLIDTPGFNNSAHIDSTILTEISRLLLA